MDSTTPPQWAAKSVQSGPLKLQGVCPNAEDERLINVVPPVSRSGIRVGGGLANGKTEFDKAQIANGTPKKLKSVCRHDVVEESNEHLLGRKVSEKVMAYLATASDGWPIESESDQCLAKFSLAKLGDLETGNDDKSSAKVFTSRGTVALQCNDLDCNKVDEELTGSNESDVGSSAVSGAEAYGERKESIVSGLQENSCVWCLTLNNQWTLGVLRSTSETEHVVSIANDNVVKVPVGKLLPANPDILEGVDDLAQLSYLNEPAVLHNLQHRYAQDMIYTKAGAILVAINPFKDVSLYGNDFLHAYRLKAIDTPHVYGLSDSAFGAMMRNGVDQSIIISGESGAGKTETSKIAMQYLVSLGGGNQVVDKILWTNPILEAFGNARTLKNNNSSRFGKLIEIHFDEFGKICGAKIHTYLLEKSRVVQQAQGERSYHIFYQLCAGAPFPLREQLNLRPAREYCYLNQSSCLTIDEVDDTERFHVVMEALNMVQISQEDQENAFAMLAAILWLGNITFSLIDNENHVRVDNNEAVGNVAKLLGCDVEELIEALSTYKIYVGNEDLVQKLTCSQAIDARDALAKAIYAYLFDWLVDCINNSLEIGKCWTGKSISILDIYGFESFDENTFEQFCINYANERLQQHFNRHMFKLEKEEYNLEGIDGIEIEFQDNQECLDLIEKKPLGLISLLDEECTFPKGTDLTLASKFEQHLKGNHCFKGKLGKAFAIHHYAGEVLYDTTGFLEKNRDMIGSNLLQLLSSCTSQLPQLFAFYVSRGTQMTSSLWRANGKKYQKQTVATKFKGQLYNLMQRLESTSPHFIRCIKPNGLQLPGVYEQKFILQQLCCSGVLEVVRICRLGYPTRMTHEKFIKRYGILLLQSVAAQDVLSVCMAILWKFKIPPEMYRVGFTKLFFRAGQVGKLEDIRRQTLSGILRLQRAFRGHKVRCYFKELKRAAIFLQSLVRGALEWKRYRLLKERYQASVTIQKKIRCRTARQKYTRARSMIILIQAVIRGWLARNIAIMQRQLHEEMSSANPIIEGPSVWSTVNSSNKCDTEVKLEDSTQCPHEADENVCAAEVKFSKDLDPKAAIRIQPSFFTELQKRLLVAEAAIREKEAEQAALHQRLQRYEAQWPIYKGKMASMEGVWKKQAASLEITINAARKSLSDGAAGIQQTSEDESVNIPTTVAQHDARHVLPIENAFNWDDSVSEGTKSSDSSNSTPENFPWHFDIEQAREFNGGRSIVTRLVEEFEHRAVRKADSQFSVKMKSPKTQEDYNQTQEDYNPVEELQNLKHRFDVWKKNFKIHLKKTKGTMQKLETSAEKTKNKWWRKRSG